jgi:hypothetical protein
MFWYNVCLTWEEMESEKDLSGASPVSFKFMKYEPAPYFIGQTLRKENNWKRKNLRRCKLQSYHKGIGLKKQ